MSDTLHLIRTGLERTLGALGPDTGDQHPTLVSIREDMTAVSLTVADGDLEEVLGAYSSFADRLATFAEEAREAAVAHDTWSARGSVGPDPAEGYAHGDMSRSHTALTTLHTARADATGVPTNGEYFMYTPAGNAAVHQQVVRLAALINSETLNPAQVSAAIKEHIAVAAAEHPEVCDTEPAWAIVDALNPLLGRRGYRKVGRDDL